ncbi:hypothetical protein IX84_31130 [Phaeodactylibacter xiamenensis]|uniref:Uncharacterized protein n=1 Tax=Phaeodactylibacter xiamenensis TaxID=1524460 RepID=A0A098RXK9_9BACT|nr:hypothetical protein IX84_31130 [Phaeodactylibacter xiamenensis]
MVNLESGTSRSRAVMGYRIRIGFYGIENMDCPASKMKTHNQEFFRNRESEFQIGQLKFKKAGKCPVEYCILYGELVRKRKIWILKINRAHLEK